MVRFSCFHTHIYNHKSKKEVHQTAESMKKAYRVFSENQALKFPCISSDLNLLVLKTSFDNPSNSSGEQVMNSSSPEHCRKSEETHACFSPEADFEIHRGTYLKKSQSLASGLDRKREFSCDDEAEDELDHGFSCEESHVKNSAKTFHSQNGVELFQRNNQGKFEGNGDMVHGESIFSIGDEKHVEEEKHEDFSPQLSDEHASDFGQITPATTTHIIERSSSLPNVRILLHASEEGSQDSPSQVYIRCHSRSFEDLDALNAKRKEVLNEVGFPKEDEERENNLQERGKIKWDKDLGGRYDSNNFSSLERDGTLSRRSDPNRDVKNQHERESLDESCKKLPSMDFKIKRIEEWVSQIDLGESSPLPDTSEPFESNAKAKRVPSVSVATVSTGKLNLKANHGMEAAKNYISSLTATSTTGQLANFGLVAIPFLSAFVSLKVLNLSGNGIVRITAGALPRGLHVLNLAKNNISTIEGLRELVRLRVLDLSYNRILRVGHGLASCSSLKELYLAGNKISEVEGLHRLLKLNILDLRFNKISTAKCLGQLAANYVSLQSLNLEGNPAQRNVGDEHLKKYLHGLLPHLVYYNKQQIKVSSLKEVAERPGRSALTAHSSDRSLRSEHKLVRKGIHNAAISKGLPSSSSHGVRGHSVRSPKRSKDHHHGRLPPAGTKGAHHNRHHFLDIGSKWLNLRPGAASIRRSRSEGNLEFA